MTYEGGCSCGKMRYCLNAEPMFVHCCHCRQCQRITGSAFVINAIIEKSNVELLSGELASLRFPGTEHTAHFCPDCATYLWSQYSPNFDSCWFVRVGTLDEPDRLPPNVHIYTESKQPWVSLADEIPAFTVYYDRAKLWPENSLDRLAQASGNPA